MKTVFLDDKLMEAFVFMDPYDKRDRLILPGSFALGSCVDDERGDEPAGLMICHENRDRLVVDWLYTEAKYRGIGIGSSLLKLAFEEAKARGLSEVSALVSDEYETNGAEWRCGEFFANDVFSDMEEGEKVLIFDQKQIAEVLAEEENNKQAATRTMVERISALSEDEQEAAKQYFDSRYSGDLSLDGNAAFSLSDGDMSFAIVDGDSCDGILLMYHGEESWYPFALEARDEKSTETLIRTALFYLEDHVAVKEMAEVLLQRSKTEQLLDRLGIRGEKYEVVNYVAKISDYEEQKKVSGNS
ncbi:MAG: GNAT family N-acetyltransferase [Lachnospiraceae bacterium]|nr:GNAT family N-acetyltransferase [Lachnospiraceae bacterium]